MPSIIEIIRQAVDYIFGQKTHITDLTKQVSDDAVKIKDLESQVFATAAAQAANQATADAAAKKLADLQATTAGLDEAGATLAAAITDHADIPLAVDPVTLAPSAPAEAPVPPVDKPAAPPAQTAPVDDVQVDKETPTPETTPVVAEEPAPEAPPAEELQTPA